MKPIFFFYGLFIASLSGSTAALTSLEIEQIPTNELIIQTHKVFVPSNHYIPHYEKDFSFNWDNYASLPQNKEKIPEIELFLKKIPDVGQLSEAERAELGLLLYKLGTFYTHIQQQPDLAIAKINAANHFMTNKQDKAWNYNQLAYAYEQKYNQSDDPADKEKALYYIHKVTSEIYPHTKNKAVAFALGIQGRLQQDDDEYVVAEESFKAALTIYDSIQSTKDDQYKRIKNKLATAILEQDGRDEEAIEILDGLRKQWAAKGSLTHNPYAAKNLISLGEAHLKQNNPKIARDEFKQAIMIYETVYGKNSELLIKPYQLLADAYDKLGNSTLEITYEKKASHLEKDNLS